MKSLNKEILMFMNTISKKELRGNRKLRHKLKQLNCELKGSSICNKDEFLKYLNAEMLLTNY